ncbi:hypothetical protein L284_15925 [Novosphingobium lindaniclasticum LE124]|uniref:Uncharacterized protein n=1 Tax=Novosphingobium lindaniclasticum LE124 TaxID=1096930 RepID=T0H6S3_9SPHN|nr:hypothetical protein L284_15925 [Novosphingobium lindaniclasticum LE124]
MKTNEPDTLEPDQAPGETSLVGDPRSDQPARDGEVPGNGVSLYFSPGQRPSAETIAALLEQSSGAIMARISHRPPDRDGWLELLASGLTFDLLGLAPALPSLSPISVQTHGFDQAPRMEGLEGIDLLPGGHIAGGAGLAPIIRTQAGLAASLALKLPVAAVGWQSARTLMEPRYFAQIVVNWLAGGTFPALGLTALLRGQDGSIATRGLARFVGSEMQLEGSVEETPADTLKLAIRVVDYLVRQGPLTETREIESPRGRLLLEASQARRQLWVWRQR